jgi:YbbR domain-containing protein
VADKAPDEKASASGASRRPAIIFDHLALKSAALLLAVMLWLVVSAREPTAEVIPVRFEPLLEKSLTIAGPLPPMRALVIGQGRDLLKLYSQPPVVRRVINAGSTDTMTVELQPSDVDIPVTIDAIVRDIQPRSILLTFSPTARKVVPVRSRLRLSAGGNVVSFGVPRFDPESVVVTGPRAAVARVDSVPTGADVRLVCGSDLGVVRLDTARLGVSVRPRQVQADVPVRIDTTPGAASRPCTLAGPSPR